MIHPEAQQQQQKQEDDCYWKMIIIFLISLTMLPFIITDFYFALAKPKSCQQIKSKHMSSMSLSTWLLVSATTASTIFVCLTTIICMTDMESKLKKESKLFTLIRYFSLIWLIVGSILFWRDIEPLQYCSQSFSDYMYAKLIIGFISFFMNERES